MGCALASCAGVSVRGNEVHKGPLTYRIAPPGAGWSSVDFDENDVAWVSRHGHVLAVNSTCEGHADAPIEVLLNHLVFGFTEKREVERRVRPLDGREAVEVHSMARLDGVPVDLTLLVLKKDGCVHDVMYVAPEKLRDEHLAAYEAMVEALHSQVSR